LRFSQLASDLIPRSESVSTAERMDASQGIDAAFIAKVVERWRGASMGDKRKVGEAAPDPTSNQRPLEQERAFLHEAAGALRREPQQTAGRAGSALLTKPLRK
jgi:hypothetical protein